MTVTAMIQARLSSSRLPGKVLQPILGEPLLWRMIERVQRAKNIDQIIVLTSADRSDDRLAEYCEQQQIDCFRGPLNDVLGRFLLAIQQYQPAHVVRLTADCPLLDPSVIDSVVAQHLTEGNDYTSNCLEYTLPDGLDVEVINAKVLERLAFTANLKSEREHVTMRIRQHQSDYQLGSWLFDNDLSNKRWTVDYPEDFAFVTEVYQRLYPSKPDFQLQDILDLLMASPELEAISPKVIINEGLDRSLNSDYEVAINEYGQVSELN